MSSLDDEVTFISAINADNRVALMSFGTWAASGSKTPPTYTADFSNTFKWGGASPGMPAIVTYVFDAGWSGNEQIAFQNAMALWSAVANVKFDPVSTVSAADFQITHNNDGKAFWNSASFNATEIGSDRLGTPPRGNVANVVSIDTQKYTGDITSLDSGKGFAFMTLLHELGHALGLGHGGPYNSLAGPDDDNDGTPGDGASDGSDTSNQFGPYDTKLWSLMSYIGPQEAAPFMSKYPVTGTDWQGYEPTTPMMLDILAVQRLYGVQQDGPLSKGGQVFGFNNNIKGLGDVYNFDVNKHPVVTLWDGGAHNTLDLSKFTQDAVIDLVPGTFSSAGGLKNNIGIAFGTIIETAIGGSGKDTLIGSSDNILTGGPGADKIDIGGGHNMLRDTIANIDGDIAYNFGQSDIIRLTKALVGHDNLTVATDHEGDTIVGVDDDDMLLVGTFGGGEFMASARNAGPDGMHTDVQFVPFLPKLFEGVGVSASAVNGITNTSFLTGDGVVKFSATEQASVSAFDNSIGYYTVGADGKISNVNILFGDTHGSSGETVNLSAIANGQQVAFFLVQNGFNQFGTLPHDLGFITQNGQSASVNGGQPIFLDSASLGILNATVFHSIQALNPGGANQVLSGVATGGHDLQIGFEDLPRATGDNDFQDVVIQIHTDRDGVLVLG